MAGILIYIPGGGRREDFPRLGLDALLDPGISVLPFDVAVGPDGGSGSLVVFDNPTFPSQTPRTYDGATQTWEPAAADGELAMGRYWVGYVTADRPMPEELQRSSLFDGLPVELDDRRVWVIPVADFLPERIVRNRLTGQETGVVKDEHREFCELANEVYEHFLSDGFTALLKEMRITIPGGYRLAQLALEKNYRVNADVVDLLGLLDRTSIVQVALAATGIALADQVLNQKKTEPPAVALN